MALPPSAPALVFTRSPRFGGLRTIGADERKERGQVVGFHPVAAQAVTCITSVPA
jgi:hypothetical protein